MNPIEYLQRISNANLPVKLFNKSYGLYVFVSNDEIKGDNIVEAHSSVDEHRNRFVLEHSGDDLFQIYTPHYDKWLFASNDTRAGDNVIEAHKRKDDDRNVFRFRPVNPGEFGRFNIHTAHYDKWLFVSNDKEGPDNVVEAHLDQNQAREVFDIILPDPIGYVLKDVRYDFAGASPVLSPPVATGSDTLTNINPSATAHLGTVIERTVTETTSWSSRWHIRTEVNTEVHAGIPLLIGGSISASAEAYFEGTKGGSVTTAVSVKKTISADVPPNSRVKIDWVITQNKITLPYTGVLISDYGDKQVEIPVSGVFEGLVQSNIDGYASLPVPI